MLKLFKYELRKTMVPKLIVFGLAAVLECVFVYGCYAKSRDTMVLSLVFLFLAGMMGLMWTGLQSVLTLHHDMNTKQSYMLFLTPNSNYAILGAKALECMVSVAIMGAFFFGLAVLDTQLMFGQYGEIKTMTDFVRQILRSVDERLTLELPVISAFVVYCAVSWFAMIQLAFFGDVLATSLLQGRKLGGLLAFVLFVVLSMLSDKLCALIPMTNGMVTMLLLRSAALLAISISVYIGTATLMERKLSV